MIIAIRGQERAAIKQETGRHGLRLPAEEWQDIAARLGRDPTLSEAFLFDVGLSEHCSYKSSRRFLKELLPPLASHVVLGPGEDAGIVSLGTCSGEEWVLVVAHESHNHPSQVLPVEGAATGIGGIVRDVYCMGADVCGVLDGLRFGRPDGPHGERVRAISRGVIQGISEYGNALGVPNLGGDVAFHEGFDENCLVNVAAFGVLPRRSIIRSRVPPEASQQPFVLILVGKPTDDTGLGGAAFASQILDPGDSGENRGAVQIHDPFLKRVLVEGMKEAFAWVAEEGIPIGCKDLGAGGLGGASSELVLAGGFGAEIDLSRVPRGTSGLGPHHVLCAETQERFVFSLPEERAGEFCDLFNRRFELDRIYPGAAAVVIGQVIPEPVYRCFWEGERVVEIPNELLTTPPILARPIARRTQTPPTIDPSPPRSWDEGGWRSWAQERLTGWSGASRAPVFRFYDQEVRGEAFLRPGEGDAGICRPIPGTSLGVAVSMDGNPDYGALDPYFAGALAVCEAARNVAASGARPLALTDCLNFGSPEDPVCLGDFAEALRGMRDACVAVGSPEKPEEPLPIVSGNVSFYNQSSSGGAIPPSPVVCCYGLLKDYGRAITPLLKHEGDLILLTGTRARAWGRPRSEPGGRVPRLDLAAEARDLRALLELAEAGLLRACHDVADGGLLRALWEMVAGEEAPLPLGVEVDMQALSELSSGTPAGGEDLRDDELLLSESPGFVFEISPEDEGRVLEIVARAGVPCRRIGRVSSRPLLSLRRGPALVVSLQTETLHQAWRERLCAIAYREPTAPLRGGE